MLPYSTVLNPREDSCSTGGTAYKNINVKEQFDKEISLLEDAGMWRCLPNEDSNTNGNIQNEQKVSVEIMAAL